MFRQVKLMDPESNSEVTAEYVKCDCCSIEYGIIEAPHWDLWTIISYFDFCDVNLVSEDRDIHICYDCAGEAGDPRDEDLEQLAKKILYSEDIKLVLRFEPSSDPRKATNIMLLIMAMNNKVPGWISAPGAYEKLVLKVTELSEKLS